MRFDDNLVRSVRIDDAHNRPVRIDHVLVDVGTNVIEPKLLTAAFKPGWTCVIEIGFEEFL
jgi:hypothetical protein